MKILLTKAFSSLMLLAIVTSGIIYASAMSTQIVGGDKDIHGCVGSAGYVWSTSSASCIRPWEQSTTTPAVDVRVGCFLFIKDLKYGDGKHGDGKSSDVIDLQNKLKEKGYLSVNPTGYFGPATLSAVKKYQRDNGIIQTGYIGEKTRGQLRNHFCTGVNNVSTTTPIAVCDYAAPPEGCKYVPGPDYNSASQCGMQLSCGDSASNAAPLNCKIWNDGCNTCSRQQVGGPMMCTMMACISDNIAKPRCVEYFQNNSTTTCQNDGKTFLEGASLSCIKTANGQSACIADASYVCRAGSWKIEGGLPVPSPILLIKDCPTSKITNMMPVMCIKAPCNPVPNSYYIYNGARHEISEFDSLYVSTYCKVPETVAY